MGLSFKKIGRGIKRFAKGGVDSLDRSRDAESRYGGVDSNGDIGRQADWARQVAERSYNDQKGIGTQQGNLTSAIQDRMASGNTISGELLRQGNQQAVNSQRSLAAGASPANSAMAARTAAMQTGRLQAGLGGQQAVAGMQERIADEQSLGGLLAQRRQQDSQNAMGGAQLANAGYGSLQGSLDSRFRDMMGNPTKGETALGGISAGLSAGSTLFSDKRLKTNIESADKEADSFLNALSAQKYDYKNPKHGKGKQLGIMAQDLEKSKLGKQAVIDTPEGKMVHGAKLAGALAAATSSMNKRLSKLEGK